MSTRWIAGNPFLITLVSNVFDLPDQCFFRVWISIHFALALRTRIECFAHVGPDRESFENRGIRFCFRLKDLLNDGYEVNFQ